MTHEPVRGERLQVMLSPEELVALDDFRFKNRMPSRAAAIRELLRRGLHGHGLEAASGAKSSDFGVLDSESNESHTEQHTEQHTQSNGPRKTNGNE